MISKFIPIFLASVGIAGGIGAGLALKPGPAEVIGNNPCGKPPHEPEKTDETHADSHDDDGRAHEYVKLNNQFVVPIVAADAIDSLVVMSLSIELEAGLSETVYQREPKLRDKLLQVLFDHANMGGFHGEFTNARNMDNLRTALTEVAQSVVGPAVSGVLITGISRQDV